jgi:hypothetical protein
MESTQHEILVHISAQSRASDDKGYLSLAKAIQEFKPAIMTRVTDRPETRTIAEEVAVSNMARSVNIVNTAVWCYPPSVRH